MSSKFQFASLASFHVHQILFEALAQILKVIYETGHIFDPVFSAQKPPAICNSVNNDCYHNVNCIYL